MTQLSGRTNESLNRIAGILSETVTERLAQAEKEAIARLEELNALRVRQEQERREKEAVRQRLLLERLPPARQGLARLLAVGKSAEMQTVLRALSQLNKPDKVVFYSARRFDGDSWFHICQGKPELSDTLGQGCEVEVAFLGDHLSIDFAYHNGHGRDEDSHEWWFQYTGEVGRMGPSGRVQEWSLESFFKEVQPMPTPVAMPRMRDLNNRRYEWSPEAVGLQLLVNCARASVFSRYFGRCLVELERVLAN